VEEAVELAEKRHAEPAMLNLHAQADNDVQNYRLLT